MVAHLQDILPIQKHLAGICPQDLIQALEQRTFPHAVIPQDRQELALLQAKLTSFRTSLPPW